MADETRTPQADPPEGSREVIQRELRRRKQHSGQSDEQQRGRSSGADSGKAGADRPRRTKE